MRRGLWKQLRELLKSWAPEFESDMVNYLNTIANANDYMKARHSHFEGLCELDILDGDSDSDDSQLDPITASVYGKRIITLVVRSGAFENVFQTADNNVNGLAHLPSIYFCDITDAILLSDLRGICS